jgi:hypothetical protein
VTDAENVEKAVSQELEREREKHCKKSGERKEAELARRGYRWEDFARPVERHIIIPLLIKFSCPLRLTCALTYGHGRTDTWSLGSGGSGDGGRTWLRASMGWRDGVRFGGGRGKIIDEPMGDYVMHEAPPGGRR